MSILLSTWGDVKYPDVKSRFNDETKRKPNMTIDYNKSMGGVDKLDQFRSYYDVAGKKFWRYIFYLYFNIAINSFICFNKSKSTNARYSLLLYYKNALLYLKCLHWPILQIRIHFYSNCKIRLIYRGSN